MSRRDHTPAGYLAAAAACALVAVLLAWAAIARNPALDVPPAIGAVASWVFMTGAVRLVQLARRPESPGDGFAVLLMAGLAAIGLWIALWPGEQVCEVGGGSGATSTATGLQCRVPFGIGALIVLLMAFHAGQRWLRRRRTGDRTP